MELTQSLPLLLRSVIRRHGHHTRIFIGALIMGVLTNGMTMLRISPSMQMVVKGGTVAAVLLDEESMGLEKINEFLLIISQIST